MPTGILEPFVFMGASREIDGYGWRPIFLAEEFNLSVIGAVERIEEGWLNQTLWDDSGNREYMSFSLGEGSMIYFSVLFDDIVVDIEVYARVGDISAEDIFALIVDFLPNQ